MSACQLFHAHLNDIGSMIRFSLVDSDPDADVDCNADSGKTPVDLTNATELKIKARAPSSNNKTWSANVIGDPLEGIMQHVTVDGDLDEIGIWILQPFGTVEGWIGHGEQVQLEVHEILFAT